MTYELSDFHRMRIRAERGLTIHHFERDPLSEESRSYGLAREAKMCLEHALAALLNIPLDDVPVLITLPAVRVWLAYRGYSMTYVPVDAAPLERHLVIGYHATGYRHAVLMRGETLDYCANDGRRLDPGLVVVRQRFFIERHTN